MAPRVERGPCGPWEGGEWRFIFVRPSNAGRSPSGGLGSAFGHLRFPRRSSGGRSALRQSPSVPRFNTRLLTGTEQQVIKIPGFLPPAPGDEPQEAGLTGTRWKGRRSNWPDLAVQPVRFGMSPPQILLPSPKAQEVVVDRRIQRELEFKARILSRTAPTDDALERSYSSHTKGDLVTFLEISGHRFDPTALSREISNRNPDRHSGPTAQTAFRIHDFPFGNTLIHQRKVPQNFVLRLRSAKPRMACFRIFCNRGRPEFQFKFERKNHWTRSISQLKFTWMGVPMGKNVRTNRDCVLEVERAIGIKALSSEYRIIVELHELRSLFPEDLQICVDVSPATFFRIQKRLHFLNLITSEIDDFDRRRRRYSLTDRARSILDRELRFLASWPKEKTSKCLENFISKLRTLLKIPIFSVEYSILIGLYDHDTINTIALKDWTKIPHGSFYSALRILISKDLVVRSTVDADLRQVQLALSDQTRTAIDDAHIILSEWANGLPIPTQIDESSPQHDPPH